MVDLVDSVRLMLHAEAEVIAKWRRFVGGVEADCLAPLGGRLVKSLGDGLLAVFPDPVAALKAVRRLQLRLAAVNAPPAIGPTLELRCGVHLGDVYEESIDVYGSSVNLAARLAGLAAPGGTVVSVEVRDQAAGNADFSFVDLGACFVKNLDQPVRAFAADVGLAHTPVAGVQPASLAPTIAVVPFAVAALAPGMEALGVAFADDLIGELVRLPDLRVLSRLSTARLQDTEAQLGQTLRDRLHADYGLLGRIRPQGDGRVLVTAQLVELAGDEVVWADRFHTTAAALFAGDDPAVPAMVRAIGQVVLQREADRTGKLPLPTLASFTLYVGGVSLLHRLSRGEFERARGVLQQLSERVPRSAPPHAMLAKWHVLRMVQGWSSDRRLEGAAARDSARRALERDPGDALSLAIDGLTASIVDGDLDIAEQRYRSAVLANANESYAWALLSSLCSYRDRPGEALDAATKALSLSPLDPALFLLEAHHALALLTNDRHAEAAEAARRSLRHNAMHTPSHRLLIIALALAGRTAEAQEAARQHAALEPGFSIAVYQQRYPGRQARHAPEHVRALREAGVPD